MLTSPRFSAKASPAGNGSLFPLWEQGPCRNERNFVSTYEPLAFLLHLGYFGPLVMGVVFSASGRPSSTAPLILLLGLGASTAGWLAGRNRLLPSR